MSPEQGDAADIGPGTLPLEGPGVLFEIRRDGFAFLIFDRPGEKVNVLNAPIVAVLEILLDQAAHDKNVRGLVVTSAKPGSFIAGADVREIEGLQSVQDAEQASRKGQRLFDALERLPFPVVAAINGTCLGGGTELALACHFRVAADDRRTEIGLPEVRLGIVPGWGGTQRMPRRVGLPRALDLVMTGRSLSARRALKAGLVDAVAPPEYLLEMAEKIVREAADGKRRPRRMFNDQLLSRLNPVRRIQIAVTAHLARRRLKAKLNERHYPAPFRALDAIVYGLRHGMEAGLQREMMALGQLAAGATCKNLVSLFFLQQAARKGSGVEEGASRPRDLRSAAVLGAGAMGGGIAQALARAGITVRLKDIAPEALSHGMRTAYDLNRADLRKRRITGREFDQRMALVQPMLDYSGVRRADVVIEAVVESVEIKQKVVREIEAATPEGTIFATNTSSLPISEIAARAERPQDIVGMHFFNPVHRMPLVEVVRGAQTSGEAIATVVALAKRMGKTPVVVGDAPGFLVNRILMTYLGEALILLEEGARIEEIDRTMVDFGMPMGPFGVLDQVGIDVAAHVATVLAEAFRDRAPRSTALQVLKEKGWLGRKAGRGFYLYRGGAQGSGDGRPKAGGADRGGTSHEVNVGVYSLTSTRERMSLDPAPTESRLVLPMINEAVRCLEEGIASSPADVDLAMVMGTGFPPFRGGLLRHADSLGLTAVVQGLEILSERHGKRFMATRLLMEMSGSQRRFYEGR
jgi:3-hydroxyacyl-CoA dehydrogenase/enoyl-CoA hydratase/3-hydroxybutyryl-CoA epimerase